MLSFSDPDGLCVELIGSADADVARAWHAGPVAGEFALRGLHAATLAEEGFEATAELLTSHMGFREIAQEGDVTDMPLARAGRARSWTSSAA